MKKNKCLYMTFLVILEISSSQDVFEGYTLFTPQTGFGGNSSTTTYLKDNNLNNIQTWTHISPPASMPYLIKGDEAECFIFQYKERSHQIN